MKSLLRTLMLCATLSASLFATKAAEASCGAAGGPASNGCDNVAQPVNASASAFVLNSNAASARVDFNAALQSTAQGVGYGGNATGGTGLGGAGGNATGGSVGTVSGGSVGNISVETRGVRNPVSSAIAPSIAPTANCAIPVTGGVSFVGFSGSMGTATLDANCVFLEQVKAVAAMGDRQTALEMMCLNEEYRSTRERMGKPCLERHPVAIPE